mmetsp:Transcript_28834/g.60585  ORF Transcript_28834/g.60585 Transcript_28834/m.60585 type:complete len:214 (-) Transcript_28834:1087-1728(-)
MFGSRLKTARATCGTSSLISLGRGFSTSLEMRSRCSRETTRPTCVASSGSSASSRLSASAFAPSRRTRRRFPAQTTRRSSSSGTGLTPSGCPGGLFSRYSRTLPPTRCRQRSSPSSDLSPELPTSQSTQRSRGERAPRSCEISPRPGLRLSTTSTCSRHYASGTSPFRHLRLSTRPRHTSPSRWSGTGRCCRRHARASAQTSSQRSGLNCHRR